MLNKSPLGRTAGEWEQLFVQAGVRVEELTNSKSSRAKAVKIGQFFSPLVARQVPIEVQGRPGTATLRMVSGRGNEKRYYFEIRWGGHEHHSREAQEVNTAPNLIAVEKASDTDYQTEVRVVGADVGVNDPKGNGMDW